LIIAICLSLIFRIMHELHKTASRRCCITQDDTTHACDGVAPDRNQLVVFGHDPADLAASPPMVWQNWRPSGVNAEFDPMAEVDGCSSARDCAEARSAGVMVEWPS
jgi:hypothetical protein